MFGNHLIFFLHIPRCGGTSTASNVFLRRRFRPHESVHVRKEGDPVYAEIPEWQRPSFRFVYGHFSFRIHELLPDAWAFRPNTRFTYVTLLREPASRVLSWYRFHALRNWGEQAGKPPSPWEWCLGEPSRELDNYMTRLISGVHPALGRVNGSHLARAKANLVSFFSVVGILEEYDRFVRDVRDAFAYNDLPLPSEDEDWHPRLNRTAAQGETDRELEAAIRERNAYDCELYDFVRETWAI